MMVELATVVNFNEPNQRAKCRARKTPEKKSMAPFLELIFFSSRRFTQTIGANNKLANNIRYILKIEAGASDHFTKMAENDIAIMEIVSERLIVLELIDCLIAASFLDGVLNELSQIYYHYRRYCRKIEVLYFPWPNVLRKHECFINNNYLISFYGR